VIFCYLFSSALFTSLSIPFICIISFFLSFRATFCFTNSDYRLTRITSPPPHLLRISEGLAYIVTDLLKAILRKGSVNTVNVQEWKMCLSGRILLTLARNHVTCSLGGLLYATIELCFLCVVRAEAI
jgi:hypothetical protein